MKKIYFITLGCKVNSYESIAIKDELLNLGYKEALKEEEADIFIINTCAVTNTASSKSRQKIHSIALNYPLAKIIVMGCYIQGFVSEIKDIPNVYLMLGTYKRKDIIEYIDKLENKVNLVSDIKKFTEYEELGLCDNLEKTRAYLKIEDGCENFCSYCIIPYVRGKVKSRNKENIIKEAKHLISLGYKEIVLTGISTGSYGKDLSNYHFSNLVSDLLDLDGLYRLRISSIEESEIDDKFIEMLKDNPKLAKHIHLPLQAGSDHVLKLMNRHYDKNKYLALVNKIKDNVPDIAITTDVIVGFPNESDDDFNDTLDLCKKVGFLKIHVFPFSSRKGTAASKMSGHIDGNVKKERVKKLLDLSNELTNKYNNNYINKVVEVLIEEKIDNYYFGHSSNFLAINVIANKELAKNDIVKVKIINQKDNELIGEYYETK